MSSGARVSSPPPLQGRQSYLGRAELWVGHDSPVLCSYKDHPLKIELNWTLEGTLKGRRPGGWEMGDKRA